MLKETQPIRKMGNPTHQPQPAIHHFTHPHPLQLSNFLPQQTLHPPSCSACKLKVSGWIYACTTCNYFLHIPCSDLPQQITHPFHPTHILTLLPLPINPQRFFNCDACGKQGNGFSYHCGICNVHLHTLCSTMPLLLTHQSHHHPLNLTFSPPYPNQGFSCDICKNVGSKEWLYRCNLCEFDAHLVCATTTPRAPIQQANQIQMQHYQAPAPSPITYYPTNPIPCVARTQQNMVSDRQVFQFLLNATIPGLGFMMQGQSGGGMTYCGGDFNGMDIGAMGGMDFGWL